MPDITIENGGTLFTFTPHSAQAHAWVKDHISLEPWQWFGPAFVVEHRYAADLAAAMIADGLEVE